MTYVIIISLERKSLQKKSHRVSLVKPTKPLENVKKLIWYLQGQPVIHRSQYFNGHEIANYKMYFKEDKNYELEELTQENEHRGSISSNDGNCTSINSECCNL